VVLFFFWVVSPLQSNLGVLAIHNL